MFYRKKILIIGILAILIPVLFWQGHVINNYFSKDVMNNKLLDNDSKDSSITKKIHDNNIEVINAEEKKQVLRLSSLKDRPITIGVYGADAWSFTAARSDVIMVINYNPITNRVVLVSIPRDARVNILGKGADKINHAYAYGGEKLLTYTLENLFKIKIDYYMRFNFTTFKKIIDQLGGVKVNSKKDYGYYDVVVPKGESILTGEQALFYVRFRQDSEGDFGRIKRQQEVINSLFKLLYSTDNEVMVKLLDNIYSKDLSTSKNINFLVLKDYYDLFKESSKVTFDDLMLKTNGKVIDGIYYGLVDDSSLKSIKKKLGK